MGEKSAKGLYSYMNDIQESKERKCSVSDMNDFMNLDILDEMMKVRAAVIIEEVAMKFMQDPEQMKTKWNEIYQ
jgi:hypothetical protein